LRYRCGDAPPLPQGAADHADDLPANLRSARGGVRPTRAREYRCGTESLPYCYHRAMSTQIAVRLSDELTSFVDAEVASGRAPSRAAVVARALERERRERIALADIEILRF